MIVYFASYPSLNLTPGGPNYKIEQLKLHLRKLGVDVIQFDMWDKRADLNSESFFHIFNASLSTYPLAFNLNKIGARYVVNPIFFSNHKAGTIRLYNGLEQILRTLFKRSTSDYEFTRIICELSEKVLPNTEAEGKLLIEALGIESRKVEVIPNGVEARFAEASPDLFERKYGLKDFILYVGHLGPIRKNGKKIIKALSQLDHPSVIIADILNNSEGKWCQEELNKSSRIKYLGWLEHDDPMLASAYAACDTFILPTRYETPGRAALEAALAGAKIVITPKGGTREYFGKWAEYPDVSSVSSIVKSVEKSLARKSEPELKKHILTNYTWPKIAEQTLEMYKKIL